MTVDPAQTDSEVLPDQASITLKWLSFLSLLAAVVWAVVRVGPRIPFPGALYTGEKWPYPNLELIQAYKRTSPTGYLLAEFLRLDTSPWLIAFYSSAALLAALLIAIWVWVELKGSRQRARGFRIAILAPVTGLLFLTIGSYDPFTVIGIALALFAWRLNSRIWLVAVGIYMGIQHFEQSIVLTISWSLAVLAFSGKYPDSWSLRRNPIWLLVGAAIGKVVLSVLLSVQGVSASEGRLYWLESSLWLKRAVVGSLNFGPVLLLSFFAGVWAIVILALLLPTTWRSRILLALAILMPATFAVITLDHTRVFVMVTVPVVAMLTVVVLRNPKYSQQRELLILVETLAWVVIPMTVQGTDTVYVDGFNFLDMSITFAHQLLPG